MRKGAWVLGLFVLALTLSGCGGLGLPSTSLGPNPTLKGKVQDYASRAEGELIAYDPGMNYEFGRGWIKRDGSFTLTLYDLAEKLPGALLTVKSQESSDGCKLEVSTGEVGWNMLGPIVGPSGSLVYANPDRENLLATLFYADRDARVKTFGSTCSLVWDLDVKKGWNWVLFYENEESNNEGDSLKLKTELPVGFKWFAEY